jgi:hypothetical protein
LPPSLAKLSDKQRDEYVDVERQRNRKRKQREAAAGRGGGGNGSGGGGGGGGGVVFVPSTAAAVAAAEAESRVSADEARFARFLKLTGRTDKRGNKNKRGGKNNNNGGGGVLDALYKGDDGAALAEARKHLNSLDFEALCRASDEDSDGEKLEFDENGRDANGRKRGWTPKQWQVENDAANADGDADSSKDSKYDKKNNNSSSDSIAGVYNGERDDFVDEPDDSMLVCR